MSATTRGVWLIWSLLSWDVQAVHKNKKKYQLNTQTHLKSGTHIHTHTHTPIWKCHVPWETGRQPMKTGKRNARKKMQLSINVHIIWLILALHVCACVRLCVSLVDKPLCIRNLYVHMYNVLIHSRYLFVWHMQKSYAGRERESKKKNKNFLLFFTLFSFFLLMHIL